MTVRAKFYVQEIKNIHTPSPGYSCAVVVMSPVYDNGQGNAAWSKATPSGKLEMTITNPNAVAAFELGKEYFLDFTPAN